MNVPNERLNSGSENAREAPSGTEGTGNLTELDENDPLRKRRSSGTATETYFLTRWIFFRLLGVIYAIAFLSLWPQLLGLIGSRGILPAARFFPAVGQQLGLAGFWKLPSLCWLSQSDMFLKLLCGSGVLLAFLLIGNVLPRVVLVLLWINYLSLSVAGQTFLSFQWDTLLLETGFFSIFFAPGKLRPGLAREHPPSKIARLLLWWLLFKLMFLSGITKLLSGDSTWRDLTALDFHYETQPIPNALAWYAHQLPRSFQKMSVVLMYVIELGAPFLIVGSRFFRYVGCLLMISLQVVIELTGNYGFFNLLTILLCVSLLDDTVWGRLLPRRYQSRLPRTPARLKWRSRWWKITIAGGGLVLLWLSFLVFLKEMIRTQRRDALPSAVVTLLDVAEGSLLRWGEPYGLHWIAPWRTINGYGLFRVMTVRRPEIVVEGSRDGKTWLAYPFRFKPGEVHRAPPIVAPHQPRLDWQMWFAALDPAGNQYWLSNLLMRLLGGSPEIMRLLGENPFPNEPPCYVRLVLYDYRFTKGLSKKTDVPWWYAAKPRLLTPPLSLPDEATSSQASRFSRGLKSP